MESGSRDASIWILLSIIATCRLLHSRNMNVKELTCENIRRAIHKLDRLRLTILLRSTFKYDFSTLR